MNLTEVMNWRYSTKEFNPDKKISDEDFEQIKNLLQMCPSSTNIQPWHFIIASSEEGKKRIAKGTQGFFIFNEAKVLNASHVVLFCTRTTADEEFMLHLLDKEDKDGRYGAPEFKEQMHGGRNVFADIHKYDMKDLQHWMDKQVYINIGNLLLGAGVMGIDAVPMEGIDMKALDEEFGLRAKGFTSLVCVALGYRAEGDFNATLPKSRLSQEEIFTLL
ncbi:oxygen-insensitive NAD(P)H nitroreductase [Flammeovirga aprica]|uniref:Oxygen-insensitive NAD(P)H nitroreductase n=1 Tax=Flammeovirga aprica JL-4 TaxID=694437 RepID=A0A7X9S1F3_9BACT|nr:oxygen-insensitive NAD(P)H nitroreductase [Flammeovirga aprica]NME72605.1 oxygen-insensitive NAD(P)H nitroreductase [Flammeovirga aprica JL-4]